MTTTLGKFAALLFSCLSISTAQNLRGIAVVKGIIGNNIHGNVTFSQGCDGGPVTVTGVITGLTPGLHGMHVHERGDLSEGCSATGPHFNPFKVDHGSQTSINRHVGDLGNIYANRDGIATVSFVDPHLSLLPTSINNIIGRSLVVHADEDDLGLGDFDDSLKTGHAGKRIACGVIGIQSADPPCASTASLPFHHSLKLIFMSVIACLYYFT